MKKTKGERVFDVANYAVLCIVGLVTLLPMVHVAAKSVSSEGAVAAGQVGLLPVGFELETYRVVVTSADFLQSLKVSVFITGVGTLLHVLVMSMAAYPLSRDRLPGKRFLTFVFVFTMMFSGGLIPTYLVMKRLNLINRLWALILPSLVSTFNLIILRNFFQSIPDDLEDSARIDGASNVTIFFSVMFPLAMPAIATVCVYTAVGFWNGYFSALIYIQKRSIYPLSLYLRSMIAETDAQLVNLNPELANLNPVSVRSAAVVASTVPILAVYPFLQRYFVQGVMLGAVKG
jgi:putative aldouronate transport system permease protein